MQTDLPVKSPRLPPQQCEIINRSSVIAFCFDGKEYTGYQGDTIASALTAAGVQILSRSFKYHRPRGLLCCSGDCPNCLVQVDDEPNIRACTRKIIPGMDVRPQNAWPSLKYDFLSLTQLGSQLMPVGFYYKTFIKPSILWPLFERILRKSAGLGKIDPNTPPGEYDKQYLHARCGPFRCAGDISSCLVDVCLCSTLHFRRTRRTQLRSESINPSGRAVMKVEGRPSYHEIAPENLVAIRRLHRQPSRTLHIGFSTGHSSFKNSGESSLRF